MSTVAAARRVLVIAGLGNGSGTGGSTARLFSRAGYSVALVARGADSVEKIAKEINLAGGDASAFPVTSYGAQEISDVWGSIRSKYPAPNYTINAAVFNLGHRVWKNFLDVTPTDLHESIAIHVEAAFSFAREAIITFKANEIQEPSGKRGTLIFTGATASLRGNTMTSAFAAGKFGLRALAQSLSKEFGQDNIHVAHTIIDGVILTDRLLELRPEFKGKPDISVNPESIANAYLYLVNQDRSALTWELDLRPAHEKW
ncbi:hypothetical protein BDZ94DRAFT_1287578 [Collybia nuda]|uniref:Short-chain dehydrogenase/reductase SDR n=1 Tax=Collybia nuda TaxID=64659 RepID=A0A9P5YEN6_9AGAR|nr:hypothetical protein BDZ94DRAFT_1287578 [Collybia nuda]